MTARELTRRGHEIVTRNWHCTAGEVDIVARRDEAWYFFEVRTRRGQEFGTPEESVTEAKLERMIDVALTYLSEHDLNAYDVDWRVGLAAIEVDRAGRVARLEIYDSIT